jgi:hypothetical protein
MDILAILKTLPTKFLNLFVVLLDSISRMLSDGKKLFIFVVVVVALSDIWAKGNVGVIGFTVSQAKEILEICVAMIKEIDKTVMITGIIAAIVWMLNKKKA